MWKWSALAVSAVVVAWAAHTAEPNHPPATAQLKTATSHITNVTVYQSNALVTREVDVPEGVGSMELVITPLPPQTVNSSLYSEGTDGIRVLTTRYRMRPIKEDTREEVRKLEAQIKELALAAQKLQSEVQTIQHNMQLLTKLESSFTAKAAENSEASIGL